MKNRFILFVIACMAVSASGDIACELKEKQRWNDPGFSGVDEEEFTKYHVCIFDKTAVISSPDMKLSNVRNEEVSEFEGNNNKQIEHLPIDVVDSFPNILKFEFRRTSVKKIIKRTFHGLSKLHTLYIEENEISSIDEDAFDDLEDIYTIFLMENKLTTLPAKLFSKLSTLDYLHLDKNQITSLDAEIFKNNHKLALLFLNDNKFKTFAPGTFSSLKRMRQIWIHNNDISTLNSNWFKTCVKLGEIRLENNTISEIPKDFFSNLESLHQVSFSNNPISTIDFAIFENNKEINEIEFNGIKVTKVLNIDIVDKLPRLQGVRFKINDSSCIIGSYHEGTLDKLKKEVKENCQTE